MKIHLLRCLVFLLLLSLTACETPNRPYWLSPSNPCDLANRGNKKVKALVPFEEYERKPGPTENPYHSNLRVIEFDEQGDLWTKHHQLRSAIEMLQKTAPQKPPLLIVFIHGWHNIANPFGDEPCLPTKNWLSPHYRKNSSFDFWMFNKLLKDLEEKKYDGKKVSDRRTVCGVFVGWRGLSQSHLFDATLAGWAWRYLGFYSRKAAADRIAEGPLVTVLKELAARTRARDGNVVFIGHSFGGRILERAISQMLPAVNTDETKRLLFPADLVLLVNPASDALYTRRLRQNFPYADEKKDARWEAPLIVSVTSKSDSANRDLYPTGQTIGTHFGLLRGDFRMFHDSGNKTGDKEKFRLQHDYVTTPSGFSPALITHKIVPEKAKEISDNQHAFEWNMEHCKVEDKTLTFRIDKPSGPSHSLHDGGSLPRGAAQVPQYQFTIKPESKSKPWIDQGAYEYWVLQTPDEILKGHDGGRENGGIFVFHTVDFFAALYKACVSDNRRAEFVSAAGKEKKSP